MNKVPSLDDQIKTIATGSPVYIEVKAGASAPDAREKGTLKSVDWSKRTLVLHHQVYGDDRTIHFDKITYIRSELGTATLYNDHASVEDIEDSMPPFPAEWKE
jgi:hypothetical protein